MDGLAYRMVGMSKIPGIYKEEGRFKKKKILKINGPIQAKVFQTGCCISVVDFGFR